MNRRLLSIILAMVLSLSLAPTAAVAQETPAEAEGSIEAAASLEESSAEAALQETMTETQSEEQTESSTEAMIPDEASEGQTESSTEAVIPDDALENQSEGSTKAAVLEEFPEVQSVGNTEEAIPDESSEVQSGGSTEAAISEESSEAPTESGTASLADSGVSSPSNESENNIDSEQPSESSVDSSTEIGEPTSQDDTQGDVTQDASISSGAAAVQALIDALPDAESINESNMEDIIAQLEAIDDAKLLLSDDEMASIDFAHYIAAISVLTGDETGLASTPMLTNGTITDVNNETELANAIAAGGSIRLTANIVPTTRLMVFSTVSIDLNGCEISSGKSIENDGYLSISDNKNTGQLRMCINNAGVLTINSGTVDTVQNFATFKITGGTIDYIFTDTGATAEISGSNTIIHRIMNYGTTTMSGGTITNSVSNTNTGVISGGEFTVNCEVSNSATISNGTFNGTVYNEKNGTIANGTFAGTVTNNSAITGGSFTSAGTVTNNGTITGGSFAGTVTNNGTITGGSYTGTVKNYGIIYATARVTDPIRYDQTIGNTITYKIGENEYAEQFVKTDATVTKPTDPTQTGCIFDGWYTDAECKIAFDFDNMTITSDITLYANFREQTHTVKFVTKYGNVDPATVPVVDSATVDEPAAPNETGYSFGGWYTDEKFITKYVFTTPVIADITLYAKWTEKTGYTIKYNTDGGTEISDKTGVNWTYEVLKDITDPTRDGYKFEGWTYSAAGATAVDVDDSTTYADLASDDTAGSSITLTVTWKDIVNPVISGIEDGKTYCAAQTVTVTDENLAKVTVNGTSVTLDGNNQFKLSPAEGAQKIVATDKDGNEATMTVTVNDGHEWESVTYKWADDYSSCTATGVCKWDQTHVETETSTPTSVVTQKQSCTTDELTTYTATFKNNGFEEQKKENIKTADKLGHSFTELRYNETQHWYKCSRCEATNAHADHSGGTATCTDRAICTLCQQPYGSTNPDNHTGTLGEWQSDGTQHWKVYSCCLEKAEIGKHVDDDKNHICDTCGYDKLGEHADADKDHKCDYGCSTLIGECVDTDLDHLCDYGCGKSFGEHMDKDKNHICDYGCTTPIGACVDEDYDHLCDYGCGKSFGEHMDKDKNHICDYGCTTPIGACVDEDYDHLCDYGCGKSFGEHADKNNDHNCDYCGEKLSEHSGGTATCKDKAVCNICGEAYGELAPHSLTHVAAKAATTEAEGNKEYWHCSICDKYFSDENATTEIKLSDTVIAKLEPETTTEAKKEEQKDMPKTGDNSNMLLWLILLLLSAGTISTAAIASRKRK